MLKQSECLLNSFKTALLKDELISTLGISPLSKEFIEERLEEIMRGVFSKDREIFEKKLIEKYGRVKKELQEYQEKYRDKIGSEVEFLQKENRELEKNINYLQNENKLLESQLKVFQTENHNMINNFKVKIEDQRQNLVFNELKYSEILTENKSIKFKMNILSSKVMEVFKKIKLIKKELKIMKEKFIDKTNRFYNDFNSFIETNNKNNKNIKNERKDLEKKISSLKLNFNEVLNKFSGMQSNFTNDYDNRIEEIELYKNKLKEAEEKYRIKMDKFENKCKDKENLLCKEINILKEKLEGIMKENINKEEIIDKLQQNLYKTEKILDSYKEKSQLNLKNEIADKIEKLREKFEKS